MVQINIYPETIAYLGGASITNTLATSVLTTLLLIVFVVFFKPKFLKAFIYWIFKFTDKITENRTLTIRIFPLSATFLIFIGFANLLSLLPGFLGSLFVNVNGNHYSLFRSPNSDLNVTIALALVSVFGMEYFSVSILGIKKFFGRFFNFVSLSKFFVGLFELLSEITKIISFSFRLFGNILAGEIVLLVAALYTPILLPLPFMAMEAFVGILQAFIFFVLTASFIRNATFRNDLKTSPQAQI